MIQSTFDELVEEALSQDFQGWDFSWTHGRWHEQEPSWNYRRLVEEKLSQTVSLLDMGTGGGEFLASLNHRPPITFATESYAPNIPIARARLEPLGIHVRAFEEDQMLPVPDSAFDLVINRHESYHAPELMRILKPGGTFLTQQVGALDCIQLNQYLEAAVDLDSEQWNLDSEIHLFENAGLQIIRAEEELLDSIFDDIGVVVFYLKVISWQIPDFAVEKYRDALLKMHQNILNNGPFRAQAHRFLIEAKKK